MDRLKEFMTVSERLTGHSHVELTGTGAADEYLLTLLRAVPEQIVDELLAAAHDLEADEATARLLQSERLGPVARNIIVLWYCGTWQALDEQWRIDHDAPTVDTQVVSATAYLSGLQWSVAHTHPPGGNPPGFGSWSQPPTGTSTETLTAVGEGVRP